MTDEKRFIRESSEHVYSLSFLNSRNQVVASGTAFFCQGYLVTNSHVYSGPADCGVLIAQNNLSVLQLTIDQLQRRLVRGSDSENFDYAVLDFPELALNKNNSLSFANPDDIDISDRVVAIGYPFGQSHASVHHGYISARYQKGRVEYLEVDASINSGNSGGPLLHLEQRKVAGIITRKATGLDLAFQELKKTVLKNIEVLKIEQNKGFSMMVGGVDPIQALEASQLQMLNLIGQIERSANVGIGYAFLTREISSEDCF